ncbi:MAG TPA: hypothetical protein DEQ40_00335, partial [Oxalobacteraceae bacterium]|nr:hypothetical protein [Oxalobacteraceae bacterium]
TMINGLPTLGARSATGDGDSRSDLAGAIPLGFEAALLALGSRQCRWPIGNPDESDFHFCTAGMVGGKVRYCEAHAWDSRLVKGGKRPVVVSFGDTALRPAREKPTKNDPVTRGDTPGGKSAISNRGRW